MPQSGAANKEYRPDGVRDYASASIDKMLEEKARREARAERLNSPEYKAKAAERARKRAAKVKAQEKEREARIAAQAEAREAEIAAIKTMEAAREKLRQAEVGVYAGTHTVEQLAVAAREFYSLEFAGGKQKMSFYPRLDKLRWVINERRMEEIRKGVLEGTHSIEDFEEATRVFYQVRTGITRRPIDEAKLKADLLAVRSRLQKQTKAKQAKDEARERREAKREAEVKRKLVAQAEDKGLSDSRRATAKAKLAAWDQEKAGRELTAKLKAAEARWNAAIKEAERVGLEVCRLRLRTDPAIEALKAVDDAARELNELGLQARVHEITRKRILYIGQHMVELEKREKKQK